MVNQEQMVNAEQPASKKPYEPPTLTVYGTVTELTHSVGNMQTKDGGQGNMSRTSMH